jgi:hypothetical protein
MFAIAELLRQKSSATYSRWLAVWRNHQNIVTVLDTHLSSARTVVSHRARQCVLVQSRRIGVLDNPRRELWFDRFWRLFRAKQGKVTSVTRREEAQKDKWLGYGMDYLGTIMHLSGVLTRFARKTHRLLAHSLHTVCHVATLDAYADFFASW